MTHEALPRWMAIQMDWKRKDLERCSPLMLLILFPKGLKNEATVDNFDHHFFFIFNKTIDTFLLLSYVSHVESFFEKD